MTLHPPPEPPRRRPVPAPRHPDPRQDAATAAALAMARDTIRKAMESSHRAVYPRPSGV